MRLSDYDPDDPPVRTKRDELHRLFGVAFLRGITAAIVLLAIGAGINGGVWDEPLWVTVIWTVLAVCVLWPLLQVLEHAAVDARAAWQSLRGVSEA